MAKAIISPCLYVLEDNMINFTELINVLQFIDQYLDVEVDDIIGTILGSDQWYHIPPYNLSLYNQLNAVVVPLLQKLYQRGEEVQITDDDIATYTVDKKYKVQNHNTFDLIVKYISKSVNQRYEFIMFVNQINYAVSPMLLLNIDNNDVEVPIVTDMWTDESGNFDKYISVKELSVADVFPAKELCKKLALKITNNCNVADCVRYGNIIAKRNGYIKLPYSKCQYKNTQYYKSKNEKYIICLDKTHGTFEVFMKGKVGYENYMGEYGFDGEYIENKTSNKETHKCYVC